ncbi:hypothetical protein J6590_043487 [Homalodisca vitripennis]|nr:hypothetical protein J6590_043487 [Homalodisca vitripennis]
MSNPGMTVIQDRKRRESRLPPVEIPWNMNPGSWVLRLSQDNQIKQRRAWLLFGQVTAERSCPCKRPACPAIGGGSEVTFKPLVPRLSVREGFLALTSPGKIRHSLIYFFTLYQQNNHS